MAAKQMLLFTPCDLFPWIKGRTLWLVGDSIQQAGSLGSATRQAVDLGTRLADVGPGSHFWPRCGVT